jgi:hypothetical protein
VLTGTRTADASRTRRTSRKNFPTEISPTTGQNRGQKRITQVFSRHDYCAFRPKSWEEASLKGWVGCFPSLPCRLRGTLLEQTMRRISEADKNNSSKSIRLKGARILFLLKPGKSTANFLEEWLTSEVQAQLNNATGSVECATGAHGRCVDSECRCRCHKSRVRARSKRRMRKT